MNYLGLVLVFFGAAFFIYSLSCKEKLNYYSRRYTKTSNMILIKSMEFFKLQFKFSIISTIYFIACGLIITIFNFNNFLVILAIIGFHFINFLLIIHARDKGYVDYTLMKINR